MSRTACLLASAGLLIGAGLAPAGDALDLVPEDAAAALAVRSLNDVKKKGDKFVADAKLESLPRPSQVFDSLLDAEGIVEGMDHDGSVAFVVANPGLLGVKLFDDEGGLELSGDYGGLFVFIVPVRDADKMAGNFGLDEGQLKPDTPIQGKGTRAGTHLYLRGKHLFFGSNAKVVRTVVDGPRASAELTFRPKRQLARADVLLYLNRKHLAGFWKKILTDLRMNLLDRARREDGPAVRQLVGALGAVRASWIAANVDDGLGLSWVNTFPEEGAAEARKFLAELSRGAGAADLAGLPEGRVLASFALRGDGERNAAFARVGVAGLWNLAFSNIVWGSSFAYMDWFSVTDRVNQVGVFTEVWKRLKGSRVAVYQNADRPAHGLLSAVAVLDTEDPERFLRELRQLARFGGDDLDLSERTGRKDDVAAVETLVRDLGDDSFSTRESASNKLSLIGEPALPYLEKALKSDDAEVRRRAADVKELIVAHAVARRKEVLDKDALRHVRPVFGFQTAPESLEGRRVDVVRVRLKEKDAKAAAALRDVFGPDWDRIRLAVQGKQVVVLLGSNRSLLATTLANLKDGKRGLAESSLLAAANGHANPTRLGELHVGLDAALTLLSGEDLARPGAGGSRAVTSFALTADPDYLQVDVWIPTAEARRLEKLTTP
jgi:hypothetical protein